MSVTSALQRPRCSLSRHCPDALHRRCRRSRLARCRQRNQPLTSSRCKCTVARGGGGGGGGGGFHGGGGGFRWRRRRLSWWRRRLPRRRGRLPWVAAEPSTAAEAVRRFMSAEAVSSLGGFHAGGRGFHAAPAFHGGAFRAGPAFHHGGGIRYGGLSYARFGPSAVLPSSPSPFLRRVLLSGTTAITIIPITDAA